MFTPMALTVLIALGGAAVLSLTFVPRRSRCCVTGQVVRARELVHARRAAASTCRCSTPRIRHRGLVVAGAAALRGR